MQVTHNKPKKSMKFRISFIFLFLLASFACCLKFFLEENSPASYYKSGGEIAAEAVMSPSLVRENEPKTVRYFRRCLFLRGKIPLKMAEYGYIPEDCIVSSPDFSDETAALYIFPERYMSELSDIAAPSENAAKNVFVVSLFPSASDAENTGIDRENAKILKFCEENGYYFLDVNSYLKDKNGRLPEIYSSDDGISADAYGRVTEYLLSHTVD